MLSGGLLLIGLSSGLLLRLGLGLGLGLGLSGSNRVASLLRRSHGLGNGVVHGSGLVTDGLLEQVVRSKLLVFVAHHVGFEGLML